MSVIVHFKVSNCVFVTDLLLLLPIAENCQCLPYSANIVFFSCLDMFILVTSKSVQFIWQLGLKSIFYYLLSFLVYLLNLSATLSTPPLCREYHISRSDIVATVNPTLLSWSPFWDISCACISVYWLGWNILLKPAFFLVGRLWSCPSEINFCLSSCPRTSHSAL